MGPVFMPDIWPRARKSAEVIARSIQSSMFRKSYAEVFEGDERWRGFARARRRPLRVGADVHLHPAGA